MALWNGPNQSKVCLHPSSRQYPVSVSELYSFSWVNGRRLLCRQHTVVTWVWWRNFLITVPMSLEIWSCVRWFTSLWRIYCTNICLRTYHFQLPMCCSVVSMVVIVRMRWEKFVIFVQWCMVFGAREQKQWSAPLPSPDFQLNIQVPPWLYRRVSTAVLRLSSEKLVVSGDNRLRWFCAITSVNFFIRLRSFWRQKYHVTWRGKKNEKGVILHLEWRKRWSPKCVKYCLVLVI